VVIEQTPVAALRDARTRCPNATWRPSDIEGEGPADERAIGEGFAIARPVA
jgi:hypothetical protein